VTDHLTTQARLVTEHMHSGSVFLGTYADPSGGPVIVLAASDSAHSTVKEFYTDGSSYVPIERDASAWRPSGA
jgi:hypothetical protein